MKVFEILIEKKPCWKGYKQIGMKKKGGKQVPNCVPTNETATAGATSAGNIATVASVPGAKRKVSKKGKYGAPTAPQATNADGTAKNAQDLNLNVMGGKPIRR